MRRVRGQMENIPHISVGKTDVWVRTNIVAIEEEDFTGWEYDEVVYSKDEYIEMVAQEAEKSKADIDYIAIMTGVDVDV